MKVPERISQIPRQAITHALENYIARSANASWRDEAFRTRKPERVLAGLKEGQSIVASVKSEFNGLGLVWAALKTPLFMAADHHGGTLFSRVARTVASVPFMSCEICGKGKVSVNTGSSAGGSNDITYLEADFVALQADSGQKPRTSNKRGCLPTLFGA